MNVVGLSVWHERRLKRLATYLWHLPNSPFVAKHEFTMVQFATSANDWDDNDSLRTCGTAGCAVGHAPFAGFPKWSEEDWNDYCCRVFGIEVATVLWEFLFSASWTRVDNTPRGAARRIWYALRHGLPKPWSASYLYTYEKSLYSSYRPRKDDFVALPVSVKKKLGINT